MTVDPTRRRMTVKVTIIGAGNMGRGIGTRVVAGGNDVEVIDHDPAEARKLADELGGRASAADTPRVGSGTSRTIRWTSVGTFDREQAHAAAVPR